MPGISRRVFLRNATVGAAAVGAAAAIGPSALGLSSANAQTLNTTRTERAGMSDAAAPEAEVMAHVANDRSGTISLYTGTRKVTIQDRALSQALLKALR